MFSLVLVFFNFHSSFKNCEGVEMPCSLPRAHANTRFEYTRGLIRLWLYKENKLWDPKMYLLYISPPPRAPHTYYLVVLSSLKHPRKIILVVLQIGKTTCLSAVLRTQFHMLYKCLSCKTSRQQPSLASYQLLTPYSVEW
jgi:hypothetical protein